MQMSIIDVNKISEKSEIRIASVVFYLGIEIVPEGKVKYSEKEINLLVELVEQKYDDQGE